MVAISELRVLYGAFYRGVIRRVRAMPRLCIRRCRRRRRGSLLSDAEPR